MSRVLFGPQSIPSIWEIYMRKEVVVCHDGQITYGTLNEINRDRGFIDLKPSIVFETLFTPDGKEYSHLVLLDNPQSRISLPVSQIRPLPEGALARIIESAARREAFILQSNQPQKDR